MSKDPAVNRTPFGYCLKPAALAWLLAALAAPLAPAADLGPDAFGYKGPNKATYSFLNIAGSGSRILAGTDDDKATLNLGFSFLFYGTPYTSVCVSTNGLLSFGPCSNANDFANGDLTASSAPDNRPAIAVFWSDLTFDGSGADAIYYQTLGSPGSRQFVVTWNNVLPQNQPSPMTFQAILSEGANTILLQYQHVDTGSKDTGNGAAATIGIRDTDGHKNGRVLQWSFHAPVLNDNLALQFTPGTPPACLKLYSFESMQDTGTLLSSISVIANKSGSIQATAPGQLSVDALVANTCAKPASFDLAVGLDPFWKTNPDGKPGNATFSYTTPGVFDPKNFSLAAFGTGKPQDQSLCLRNVTLNAGSSFLATVHAAITSETLASKLPGNKVFNFSATLYTGGTGCSGTPLANPALSTLPFTIK